jgi:SAM-dependent methyltransferase
MNRDKELYKQLRTLPWNKLWIDEVPRFNAATARERLERVAVIRAAAVVFATSGPRDQLSVVKVWLRSLLNDPQEKIRRYAIAALPKLGGEDLDEKQLLALSKNAVSEREKKHVAAALSKIGGAETLRHADLLPVPTLQRVKASVLRTETPSAIKLEAPLKKFSGIEILLHCRAGLEKFVRDEAESLIGSNGKFRLIDTKTGLVILAPTGAFTFSDIFKMRCFATVSFGIGITRGHSLQAAADLVTSPLSLNIFRSLTEGPIRYRLDFAGKGHQRAAVRDLAQHIYAKSPDLINGGGDTPWTIEIHSSSGGNRIELAPKILPDPRFAYRRRDIPAASHPPLAACMARLSVFGNGSNSTEGNKGNEERKRSSSSFPSVKSLRSAEIVWDPFCGSGLELIERCLLGGVKKIIATDLNPEALEIAKQNFAAAQIKNVETQFVCSDFRNFDPGQVSLVITNPPMGKRVPIPNLRQLIQDLFTAAARHLAPGGRLVFANPLDIRPANPALKLDFSQLIDFGGFHCPLEKYVLNSNQGG